MIDYMVFDKRKVDNCTLHKDLALQKNNTSKDLPLPNSFTVYVERHKEI